MGMFGGFVKSLCNKAKSCASSVVDGVKRVGNYVGEKIVQGKKYVVENVKNIKTKVSNTVARWSGKEEADKAKELYAKIERKFNEEKRAYDANVEKYTARIKDHVYNINFHKERINSELLPAFRKAIDKFWQYNLPESLQTEEYTVENLKVEEMRSKSELISIDWDENYWTNTIKAVFTLGFLTRKEAHESMRKVEEEEYKVEENIAKMHAEKTRLECIDRALGNVEYYFQKVIEYYEVMLVRIDNAINTLYVNCLTKLHKFVHQEMSIRRLSKMQIKELEAAVTASECLRKMMNTQVLITEESSVKNYNEEIKVHYETVESEYQAA